MKRKSANPEELIPCGSIEQAVLESMEEDAVIDGRLFEQDALENIRAHVLDFAGCVFRRVQFDAVQPSRTHFSNCRFENCDISGLSFKDGTLTRVEFIGCRGAGTSIDRTKLKDVLFKDCQLNYLTLSASKLERVEFSGCDLTQAMFLDLAQKDLVLSRCCLRAAEFQSTSLKDVDLSDCVLDGIALPPDLLRGAIVSLDQAPLILGLYGIKINL